MLVCEFCGSTFKTKSILTQHQNRAKYCLEKQGIMLADFECKFCFAAFTTKTWLEKHEAKCKSKDIHEKYQTQIKELEKQSKESIFALQTQNIELTSKNIFLLEQLNESRKQLDKLQITLADLAHEGMNKHTVTNKNKIQVNTAAMIMCSDTFKEKIDNDLTMNHVMDAPDSLSEFIYKKLVTKDGTSMYVCTDAERRNFYYYDKDGYKIEDKKGHTFWSKIKDPLFDACGKLLVERVSSGDENAYEICTKKSSELDKYKDGIAIMGGLAARVYQKKVK